MMKKISVIVVVIVILLLLQFGLKIESEQDQVTWWQFQSVDTMKYSRDVSREKLHDPTFDIVINQQVSAIAQTGATHVAIATPYDEEFFPILKRWVLSARRHGLSVWFRGNWSGWEGWFGYPRIDRNTHIAKTAEFIRNHADIFQNGDVFSACPECENGGPGDPRHSGDVKGHRAFLIDEYEMTKQAFKEIKKNVTSNYNSMNGDVAELIMDKETTAKLDGLIVIDHYVATYEQILRDAEDLAKRSGGKIVFGEFGAPIPDIHGQMTEEEQSKWLHDSLYALAGSEAVVGINYWVSVGGSTSLWMDDGTPKKGASTLATFFDPTVHQGVVVNEAKQPVRFAQVQSFGKTYKTNSSGQFMLPVLSDSQTITITASGYDT